MRAILAILVGFGLIAVGLRVSPELEEMPTVLAVIVLLFGVVIAWAGFSHGLLRIRRHRAYAGGRERRGHVRLLKPLGADDDTAILIFANSHSEWLMTVDLGSLKAVKDKLDDGLSARAYLGDDDKIYGLDIGSAKALPISPGVPYEGKLRERIEWAERKKAEWAAKMAEE